jgi:hypothetical protein
MDYNNLLRTALKVEAAEAALKSGHVNAAAGYLAGNAQARLRTKLQNLTKRRAMKFQRKMQLENERPYYPNASTKNRNNAISRIIGNIRALNDEIRMTHAALEETRAATLDGAGPIRTLQVSNLLEESEGNNDEETITNAEAVSVQSNSNASSALSVANENYSGLAPSLANWLRSKGMTKQQFLNEGKAVRNRAQARKAAANTKKKSGFMRSFWNSLTRKGLGGGSRNKNMRKTQHYK